MRFAIQLICRLGTILFLVLASNTSSSNNHEVNTYVFECGTGETYVVQTDETEAWVFRPEGSLQLPALPTSDIETYRSNQFELQIKAETARLFEAGKPGQSCVNNRKAAVWEHAKLNGADFRAVGNEPGWVLEIQQGSRIVLLMDYGKKRKVWALPQAVTDQATLTTRWDTGTLKLEVSGAKCLDTMSGESFESTVVVFWNERVLRGCGRALH